jgi:hypothetical protein
VSDPGALKTGPASRPSEQAKGGQSYWDSKGGEWRYSPEGKYRNPHWDYNPWQKGKVDGLPGNKWRNVPIDGQPTHKPDAPVKVDTGSKSSVENNKPSVKNTN